MKKLTRARRAMREVVLTEYQTLEGVALQPSECDGLRRAVSSLRVQPTLGRPGCYDLTPSATVGALEVGSLAVIIRPKIPIDRLMFLVSYSLDPKSWADTPFGHSEAKSIVDAVVPAFVFHVRRAVKRGLLQQYRLEEDALQTIRGRLDVGQHVSRRFGLAPPIDVCFDEFTEDHLLNRLIKTALLALERSVVRSGDARRLLHAILPLFERVRAVSVDVRSLPAVHYTRLNRHYRPAVEFAMLILRACAFEHQHGTAPSRAFLLDMSKVFEAFVVVALREELRLSAEMLPQGRGLPLDVEQRVTLRPDLSWWERGRPVFVGDVKYKALDVRGYQHGDLYQLLAYAVAADLQGGLLLYASGEGDPGRYRVRHLGRLLEVHWLDVAGRPDEVLKSVSRAGEKIRSLRLQAVQCGAVA